MRVHFTDIDTLFRVEEDITRGLWSDIFTFDPKEDILVREQSMMMLGLYTHRVLDRSLVDIVKQLCRPRKLHLLTILISSIDREHLILTIDRKHLHA